MKINDKSKKGDKDQESIQSSTTPDPGYQKTQLNITNGSQSQPFPSRRPQGSNEQKYDKYKT